LDRSISTDKLESETNEAGVARRTEMIIATAEMTADSLRPTANNEATECMT